MDDIPALQVVLQPDNKVALIIPNAGEVLGIVQAFKFWNNRWNNHPKYETLEGIPKHIVLQLEEIAEKLTVEETVKRAEYNAAVKLKKEAKNE